MFMVIIPILLQGKVFRKMAARSLSVNRDNFHVVFCKQFKQNINNAHSDICIRRGYYRPYFFSRGLNFYSSQITMLVNHFSN